MPTPDLLPTTGELWVNRDGHIVVIQEQWSTLFEYRLYTEPASWGYIGLHEIQAGEAFPLPPLTHDHLMDLWDLGAVHQPNLGLLLRGAETNDRFSILSRGTDTEPDLVDVSWEEAMADWRRRRSWFKDPLIILGTPSDRRA